MVDKQDAGTITVNGLAIGTVTAHLWEGDDFTPDVSGYTPEGRAGSSMGLQGRTDGPGSGRSGQGGYHTPHHRERTHGHPYEPGGGYEPPVPGQEYTPSQGGRPFTQGSRETDAAIVRAAREHNLDPNTMRGIASIESSMNPASNADARTQYKGLYQIGRDEWRRFGQGNIYSAEDNANAAARMFAYNRDQFRTRFGREPTDTELYMMHQQGLGFYTRGAMTNIQGNPYPGMRGEQSHETFEGGWGRELARRKAGFARSHEVQQTPAEQVQGGTAPL